MPVMIMAERRKKNSSNRKRQIVYVWARRCTPPPSRVQSLRRLFLWQVHLPISAHFFVFHIVRHDDADGDFCTVLNGANSN